MEWNGKFMWDSLGIDLIQSGKLAIFKTNDVWSSETCFVQCGKNQWIGRERKMFKTFTDVSESFTLQLLIWFSLVVSVSVCGLIEKLSLSKMPFEDDPVIGESIKPLYICIFKNLL